MVVYFNINDSFSQGGGADGTSGNPFDFNYLLSGTSGFGITSGVTSDIDIDFKITGYRKINAGTTRYTYNLGTSALSGVRFTLEPWSDSNESWGIHLRAETSYYQRILLGSPTANNWTIIKKAIICERDAENYQISRLQFNNVFAYSCVFRVYAQAAYAFAINNCNGQLALCRFFGCTFCLDYNGSVGWIEIVHNAVNNYSDYLGCLFINGNDSTSTGYIFNCSTATTTAKIRCKYCVSNMYNSKNTTYEEGTLARNTMIRRDSGTGYGFSVYTYPTFVEPLSANTYATKASLFQGAGATWPPGGSINTNNDNWKSRTAYYYNSIVNTSAIPLISAAPAGWTIEDLPAAWGI